MRIRKILVPWIGMMATLLGMASLSHAQNKYEVPLFLSASDPLRQGFLRIINLSLVGGTATLRATDDSGRRFGPINIQIDRSLYGYANSMHFNSSDLENGNQSYIQVSSAYSG